MFLRSATQVDSETDEDMPRVRQATSVAHSAPEVFPKSDDANVEVAILAGHAAVGGPRRVVLVPLSPGILRLIQDRTAGSCGRRFAVLESDDETVQVGSIGVPAQDGADDLNGTGFPATRGRQEVECSSSREFPLRQPEGPSNQEIGFEEDGADTSHKSPRPF